MAGIGLAGTSVTLESRGGECLTDTLLRGGYMMRLSCKRGGCGLCRVHIDAGQTVYSTTVDPRALPLEERDRGIVLACRAVPVGDVTISVPEAGRLRCIAPFMTSLAARKAVPAGSLPAEGEGGAPD